VLRGVHECGFNRSGICVSALSIGRNCGSSTATTLDKRFVDKASGKELHRPQQEQLTGYVREGDTVICHSMDRLARNLDDLRKVVLGFTDRGVHVRFEKENLTFTGEDSPMSHLLLSVMGAFAQFERDLIRERQQEGIALSKLREGPMWVGSIAPTPGRRKIFVGGWQPGNLRRRLLASLGSVVRLYIGTLPGK
jgi:DNA invertase Pin-like site-specific DNA recombinase